MKTTVRLPARFRLPGTSIPKVEQARYQPNPIARTRTRTRARKPPFGPNSVPLETRDEPLGCCGNGRMMRLQAPVVMQFYEVPVCISASPPLPLPIPSALHQLNGVHPRVGLLREPIRLRTKLLTTPHATDSAKPTREGGYMLIPSGVRLQDPSCSACLAFLISFAGQ